MRRRAPILGAIALALGCAAPAGAVGPTLTAGAGAPFPERSYTLTLPTARSIDAGAVRVTENGRPVHGVSVVPADGASAYRFGVLLLIDASKSMRGRPLRTAVAAARLFVSHRNAGQPVALMTFAGVARLVQPFTTDSAAIARALDGVAVMGGNTHLLDAAAQAVATARAAHIPSGSVILLSDGGERGSVAKLQEVTQSATQAGVRVFGIGLPSRHAHFGALNLLAAETGGEFTSVAATSDLTRVYDRLGSRLAGQYLVRYRSAAAPGARVRVALHGGPGVGTVTTEYKSPALPAAGPAPFHRAPIEGLWVSSASAFAASLAAAMLLGVGLWLLLRPRASSARMRLAAYVRPAEEEAAASPGESTGRVLDSAARSIRRTTWGPRFEERLDIAGIQIPPARLLSWVGLATLLALVLFGVALGPAAAVLGFAVPGAAWSLLSRRVERQRRLFSDQLPDNLQVIASAMRAGHSFSGAMSVVVDDAPEPTRRELQRVVADERLGVPIEEALTVVVRRMDSKDLEQVALVAALQRQTGGNTAEVLDRVVETVRDRLALRRMVRTLTAQGRLSRWVVSLLPAGLLAMITLINPDYISPLYTTSLGRFALIIAAVMVVSGSLVIKRIVNIKV